MEYPAGGGVLGSMYPLLHPALVQETALRSQRISRPRGLATRWDKR